MATRQNSPRSFEYKCARCLQQQGYTTHVTKASHDGGKDIVAYKDGRRYVVECKMYKGTVGRPIIQKLHSVAITERAKGIVMTTGKFSKEAEAYADKCNIELIKVI